MENVSLFLDETGEPVAQQRDSTCLKNKDASFSPSTTDPVILSLIKRFVLLFKIQFCPSLKVWSTVQIIL